MAATILYVVRFLLLLFLLNQMFILIIQWTPDIENSMHVTSNISFVSHIRIRNQSAKYVYHSFDEWGQMYTCVKSPFNISINLSLLFLYGCRWNDKLSALLIASITYLLVTLCFRYINIFCSELDVEIFVGRNFVGLELTINIMSIISNETPFIH